MTTTLTAPEALLALATSPHVTEAMRKCIDKVLREHARMHDALEEVHELIEGYVDVRDTDFGPAANKAMQAQQVIDTALGRRP